MHSLVMKLIDSGETVGVAVDDYGLSIVHFALMKGSLPMIEDLVEIGRAKVNLKYLCPQAPLSAAIALHEVRTTVCAGFVSQCPVGFVLKFLLGGNVGEHHDNLSTVCLCS